MSNLNLATQHLTLLNKYLSVDNLFNFSKKKYDQIKSSAEDLVASLTVVSPDEDIEMIAKISSQFEDLKSLLEWAKSTLRPIERSSWESSDARKTISVAIAGLDPHYQALLKNCDFSIESIEKLRKILNGPQRLSFEKILAQKVPQAVIDDTYNLYYILGSDILELGLYFAKREDRHQFSKNLKLDNNLSIFLKKIKSSSTPSAYIEYALSILEKPEKLGKSLANTNPELVLAHAELFSSRLNKDALLETAFGFSDTSHKKQFVEKCGVMLDEMESYSEVVSKSHQSFPDRIFEKGICLGYSLALASQENPIPNADTERRGRFLQVAYKLQNKMKSRPLASHADKPLQAHNPITFLDQSARILGFSNAKNLLRVIDLHFEIDKLSNKIHKLPKNDLDRIFFGRQRDNLLKESAEHHVSKTKELFPMSLLGFDKILTSLFDKRGKGLREQINSVQNKNTRNRQEMPSISDLQSEMKPLQAISKKCPFFNVQKKTLVSKKIQVAQGFRLNEKDSSLKETKMLLDSLKSISDSHAFCLFLKGKKESDGHVIYVSFEKMIFIDSNDYDFKTTLPYVRTFQSREELIQELIKHVKLKYEMKNDPYTHFRINTVVRTPRPIRP